MARPVPTSARIPLVNPSDRIRDHGIFCEVCNLTGHTALDCAELFDTTPSPHAAENLVVPSPFQEERQTPQHGSLASFIQNRQLGDVDHLQSTTTFPYIDEEEEKCERQRSSQDHHHVTFDLNPGHLRGNELAEDEDEVEFCSHRPEQSRRGVHSLRSLILDEGEGAGIEGPDQVEGSPERPRREPKTYVLPFDLDVYTSQDVLRESRNMRRERRQSWERTGGNKVKSSTPDLFNQVEEWHRPRAKEGCSGEDPSSSNPVADAEGVVSFLRSDDGMGGLVCGSEGDPVWKLAALNQELQRMEIELKTEIDKRLATDARIQDLQEDARAEISAARTVSMVQAQQFEDEMAHLRLARQHEADTLAETLRNAQTTEKALVEELDKVNFELSLVHSELRSALSAQDSLASDLEKTRQAAANHRQEAKDRIQALESELHVAKEKATWAEAQHSRLRQDFTEEFEIQNHAHSQTAEYMSELFKKLMTSEERQQNLSSELENKEDQLQKALEENRQLQSQWVEFLELRHRTLWRNSEADQLLGRADAASARATSINQQQGQQYQQHRGAKSEGTGPKASNHERNRRHSGNQEHEEFSSHKVEELVLSERRAAAAAADRVRAAEKQAMYWQILEVDQAKSMAPKHLRKFNLAFRAFITCVCGEADQFSAYQIALALKDMVYSEYTVFVPKRSKDESSSGSVAEAAVQLAELAYTFVLIICGGGDSVVSLPENIVAELHAAVSAGRQVLIAAEVGVELPLPELDTSQEDETQASSNLTQVLHQAWSSRIIFPIDAPDDAAPDLCRRLGAPDWMLEKLPTEVMSSPHSQPDPSTGEISAVAPGSGGDVFVTLNWPNLQTMSLPGLNGDTTATCLEGILSVNTTMTQLNLQGCDMLVTAAVIRCLEHKRNTTLESVTVGGGLQIPVASLLRDQVKTLTLQSGNLGAGGSSSSTSNLSTARKRHFRQEDLTLLIACLGMNTSLTELKASGGVLNKPEGASQLLAAAKTHPNIATLCSVPLTLKPDTQALTVTGGCGTVAALVVAEHLGNDSLKLSTLTLEEGPLDAQAAVLLANALREPTHLQLTSLTLKELALGSEKLSVLLGHSDTASCRSILSSGEVSGESKDGTSSQPQSQSPMASLGSLEQLTISQIPLENEGGKVVAAFLTANPSLLDTLKEVDISGCKLGDVGVRAILRGLSGPAGGRESAALKVLRLHSNLMGDLATQAVAGAVEEACGGASGCLRGLAVLDLHQNRSITCQGLASLAKALTQHPAALTELDLSMTAVSCQGVSHLRAMLTDAACQVEVLKLVRCAVKEEGARHLATALRQAPTGKLRELYLGRNTVGDKGAFALAHALETNSSLRTLDLQANCIKSEGLKALQACLKDKNTSLTKIMFTDNQVDSTRAEELHQLAALLRKVKSR